MPHIGIITCVGHLPEPMLNHVNWVFLHQDMGQEDIPNGYDGIVVVLRDTCMQIATCCEHLEYQTECLDVDYCRFGWKGEESTKEPFVCFRLILVALVIDCEFNKNNIHVWVHMFHEAGGWKRTQVS